MWHGIVNRSVKFRKGPSDSYDTIKISMDIYNIQDIDFFLTGMDVSVIGRTEKKFCENGIENYYYFIAYGQQEEVYFGWVFAEYIGLVDESKRERYQVLFKEHLNNIRSN